MAGYGKQFKRLVVAANGGSYWAYIADGDNSNRNNTNQIICIVVSSTRQQCSSFLIFRPMMAFRSFVATQNKQAVTKITTDHKMKWLQMTINHSSRQNITTAFNNTM